MPGIFDPPTTSPTLSPIVLPILLPIFPVFPLTISPQDTLLPVPGRTFPPSSPISPQLPKFPLPLLILEYPGMLLSMLVYLPVACDTVWRALLHAALVAFSCALDKMDCNTGWETFNCGQLLLMHAVNIPSESRNQSGCSA